MSNDTAELLKWSAAMEKLNGILQALKKSVGVSNERWDNIVSRGPSIEGKISGVSHAHLFQIMRHKERREARPCRRVSRKVQLSLKYKEK